MTPEVRGAAAKVDVAIQSINSAITCLAGAGAQLIGSRHAGGTGDALLTALRDDLTAMIGDAETLKQVLREEAHVI